VVVVVLDEVVVEGVVVLDGATVTAGKSDPAPAGGSAAST
jgi:hypothetical protein